MNTTIVPPRQAGNRDSEASASTSYERPPYATALDALRALEISYGTASLARAMQAFDGDAGFADRRLAANPDRVRSILGPASHGRHRELEQALATTARTARAYPGTKAA